MFVRNGDGFAIYSVILEAVSKSQIMFKGKARRGEKAESRQVGMSVLSRYATQPLGIRWDFEIVSHYQAMLVITISSTGQLLILANDFITGRYTSLASTVGSSSGSSSVN